MKTKYYVIRKCEEFSMELVSCGLLPHKYLTFDQARLKIKTLDKNFIYVVEEFKDE